MLKEQIATSKIDGILDCTEILVKYIYIKKTLC